ncbi:hypothetical protein PoB_006517500 [Plakobranchus ocellatus]|uniref:Uncharacterized protein n=1 Tax=Plakobranchus ocellatus TaxID=259542 RepID=A0AAV4D3W7_9GAST|nr:hypothetical protein PoB_006517500 [Plakobranchus ocellatus]
MNKNQLEDHGESLIGKEKSWLRMVREWLDGAGRVPKGTDCSCNCLGAVPGGAASDQGWVGRLGWRALDVPWMNRVLEFIILCTWMLSGLCGPWFR